MKKALLTLLLLVCSVSSGRAAVLYAMYTSAQGSALYWLDSADSYSPYWIGDTSIYTYIAQMVYGGGVLYGVDSGGQHIYTLDTSGNAFQVDTLLGSTGVPGTLYHVGLLYDGDLFMYCSDESGRTKFYLVNTTDGSAALAFTYNVTPSTTDLSNMPKSYWAYTGTTSTTSAVWGVRSNLSGSNGEIVGHLQTSDHTGHSDWCAAGSSWSANSVSWRAETGYLTFISESYGARKLRRVNINSGSYYTDMDSFDYTCIAWPN